MTQGVKETFRKGWGIEVERGVEATAKNEPFQVMLRTLQL
jgi:hypothetical protein